MQNSRDLSLWRSLALAFGDGLAFGVGMKLSQNAVRSKHFKERPRQIDRTPPAAMGSYDNRVLEAVVNALEARLNEHSAQMERRLAELESRIAVEMRELQQRPETLAATLREDFSADTEELAQRVGRRMEKELTAVREEMLVVNREFAQSVSRIVGQRMDAGAVELRQSMARMISEQVDLQMDAATDALQHSVDERLSASDARMMDFISGIGQVCRQATERGERGSDENPPSAEAPATAQADLPVPEFTQTKTPTGLWRVPLVSSLVLTAAGLLALHYL